jgi:hypothetical protein
MSPLDYDIKPSRIIDPSGVPNYRIRRIAIKNLVNVRRRVSVVLSGIITASGHGHVYPLNAANWRVTRSRDVIETLNERGYVSIAQSNAPIRWTENSARSGFTPMNHQPCASISCCVESLAANWTKCERA